MAVYGEGYHCGFMVAGADLSALQFTAVKLSTAADNTVLACSTGNEQMFGVLQNKPKSGEAADVQQAGITKGKYGGGVTRGDLLELNSSGQFVPSTVAGHIVVGQAAESGSSGEIHNINVFPQPYAHA